MRTKLGTLLFATIAMMDGYNTRPYAVHSKKHNQKDPRKYFDIEGTMVFAMNKQEAKKKFLKGLTK
jgi:hypothetical protein